MFYITKKGEWVASVDFFETALRLAREMGGCAVYRTRDDILCARFGRSLDFVDALMRREPLVPLTEHAL